MTYRRLSANRLLDTAAGWAAANPVLAAGVLGHESDTGVVRVGDGTTAFLSLSAGVRTCKQTAQITNNTIGASTDIPGLALSVQAGHVYVVEFLIVFSSDTATTGLTLSATTPAQTHGFWRAWMQQAGSGTDQYFEQSSGTSFGATSTSSAIVTPGTSYNAGAKGVIKPSADGTIQLRARTEVDASTITVLNLGVGHLTDLGV